MEPYIEQRLIQLLRESRAPSVPLRQVYSTLLAEAGPGVGSCARLAEDLGRRRDVFAILEVGHPLGEGVEWPPGARSEYEAELAASGIDTSPHVTLVDPGIADRGPLAGDDCVSDFDADAPPVRQLHESLMRMWTSVHADERLRNAIARALASCGDLPDALSEDDQQGAGSGRRGDPCRPSTPGVNS